MPSENLKQKAATSMVWTAFEKYSTMFIAFVSGIVLARLLTPHDFGCIGMLSIFMVLAEAFIDGGFGSALIQKKCPTQEDYSTIFYWNLGMAAIMYAILYVSAPAIARFYSIPMLCSVLRVQALVLFIYAFNIIQRNQLRKRLNFKVLSIVSIITSLISLGVTIYLAYSGFGVWALVASNLISSSIPAIVYWFYVKWHPLWAFSKQSFKELFGFGFYMFLSSIVNQFCSKLIGLLIGKVYSPTTLGYFSKAMGTEQLASGTISSVMTQVTYPLYSKVQDDKAVMANMIKRMTTTIAYITFPLMFVLMLTAKPIFVLLYSERWLASVPYFQVLCLVGLSSCLQSVNTQTLAAIGKSKLMFQWTLIKRGFGVSFMIGGLYFFGMKGLLVGVVAYNWFCYFVNIALVSRYIGYKWQRQLLDLMPMAAVSVFAAGVAFIVSQLVHFTLYPDGIIRFIVIVLIYLGWSIIFKPESFTYTFSVIPEKLKFWEKRSYNKCFKSR